MRDQERFGTGVYGRTVWLLASDPIEKHPHLVHISMRWPTFSEDNRRDNRAGEPIPETA